MKAIDFARLLISLKRSLFNSTNKLDFDESAKNAKSLPTKGNLVLNKYLHIGQMFHIYLKRKKLFEDDIICFLNGGIVIDVYRNWWKLMSENNTVDSQIEIEKGDFAEELIDLLRKYDNPLDLIEISHMDPAWQKAVDYIEERKTQNKIIDMEKHYEVYKEIFTSLAT